MRKIFNILILVFTLIISVNLCDAQITWDIEATAWNNVQKVSSGACGDQYKIEIKYNSDQNNLSGFYIVKSDGKKYPKSYSFISDGIDKLCWGDCFYSVDLKNGRSKYILISGDEVNGYSVSIQTSEPECGPQKPIIDAIDFDGCIENLQSLLDPPSVTYAGTNSSGHWALNGNSISLSDITINDVGKNLTYVATDDNGTTISPAIEIKASPTVSNLSSNLLYCSENGAYDLSQHIVSDNGATATTQWYFKSANDNDFSECNSNPESLAQEDELKVVSSNACGSFEQTMTVDFGCKPIVNTVATPASICDNTQVSLEIPKIEYFDESTDSYEWQAYLNGNWTTFDPSIALNRSTYNGVSVRLAATNDFGTSYSNEVELSILSKEPDFEFTKSSSSVFQSYGNSSSSVTYTVTKTYSCNEDDIEFDISDNTNFSYDTTSNSITIKLKDGRDLGDYETTVYMTVGSNTQEDVLSGAVKDYPKSFPIKRSCYSSHTETVEVEYEEEYEEEEEVTDEDGNVTVQTVTKTRTATREEEITVEDTTTETIYWETDSEGTLCIFTDDLSNCKYVNEGTIEVENFYFGSRKNDGNSGDDGRDLSRMTFTNAGSIIATNDIKLGSFTYGGKTVSAIGGSPYSFLDFDCNGIYKSENLSMNFRNGAESIKGAFYVSSSLYMTATAIKDGKNFTIDECALIIVDDLELSLPGGAMKLGVEGHLVADNININVPNIISYNGAIITLGGYESNLVLVMDEGSILNLCFNPTKKGDLTLSDTKNNITKYSDPIGFINGTVMYTYGNETGWNTTWNPELEGDVNLGKYSSGYGNVKHEGEHTTVGMGSQFWEYLTYSAKELIPAYSSKENCMNESVNVLLGYDDDPFMPNDKEIKLLYEPINYCSDKYKNAIITIRELGNRKFRYINGELIYCEGDN